MTLSLTIILTLILTLLSNPGSSPGHLCREFSTCRQIASRFPELDLATSREVNYEVYTYQKGSYHTTSRVLDECRTFVLHFGQWDLGYPRGYPTALGDFEERLRGSIAWIRARYPTSPVYLLPTNYVPLNCLTTRQLSTLSLLRSVVSLARSHSTERHVRPLRHVVHRKISTICTLRHKVSCV